MDNIRDMKIPTSIFLHLLKVFDTLNFDILLCKLKYYGIDGISLNLIKSYITNRFQYVQFEKFTRNKNWYPTRFHFRPLVVQYRY